MVLLLGVAAAVVFGVVLPASSAQAQAIETTAIASLQTIEQSVSTTGTLHPVVDEDVDFVVSGTVTSVKVEAGEVVTAGQTLATVDTLQLTADLLSARATLADAQARLADDSGSSAARAANQASVAVAEAGVAAATKAVADATLVAPVAGTITSVGIDVGDSVGSAGGGGGATSGTTSTAAFHIAGTDAWQVSATLGEADLALIAQDDQVELSLDDGTAFFGTVSSIGLLPDTSSGAAAYPVTIAVTGTAKGLFDGVSVTAAIVYERRTDVLAVPSAAVSTASDGTSTVTVIGADGAKTETPVTVGETSGNLTEITGGLAEGDEVLVATFTPGSGNAGTNPGFPGGGQFPGGGKIPGGGQGGQFPAGGTGTAPGE
ncbi:MAG: HlyD family efflux transporter periplasmic adaptor subunit [Schumannella sp.]|nr:HlyD family efflux transporter periplasmic adaptor subunit [Schumannella sp.]